MSLIIATGSNQGDRLEFLNQAVEVLKKEFFLNASSRIYQSKAHDFLNQPDFLNQLHEFSLPSITAMETLNRLKEIEKEIGRIKSFEKGPRTIDIDIIFWGLEEINDTQLTIPHAQWIKRSFVIRPLQELPFFKIIEKHFTIPKTFESDAFPITI